MPPALPPRPNEIYISGLPEHARIEDLQNCFGKIGTVLNVEVKYVCQARPEPTAYPGTLIHRPGYGFVGFESREAAEESIAKYNDAFFMGNIIRVALSHRGLGGAKYNGGLGPCFKCWQLGHWVRFVGSEI